MTIGVVTLEGVQGDARGGGARVVTGESKLHVSGDDK